MLYAICYMLYAFYRMLCLCLTYAFPMLYLFLRFAVCTMHYAYMLYGLYLSD